MNTQYEHPAMNTQYEHPVWTHTEKGKAGKAFYTILGESGSEVQ